MKQNRIFKNILAILLLCATFLSVSCSNGAGNVEGTTELDLPTEAPTSEQTPTPEELAPDFAELVAATNPVAAWSFDGEATGSNTVTELVSGKKHQLVGASLAEGRNGQALLTASDEKTYLDLGQGTLGKLVSGKDSITVSMWILPYLASSLTYRLFSLYVDGNTVGIQANYKCNSVTISARAQSNGTMSTKTYSYDLDDGSVGSISEITNEGRWQHLTFVVDFKNDDISLFVNGKRAFNSDSVSFRETSFKLGSPALSDSIGGCNERRVFSFNGMIDSVMVFDRALKSEEVKTVYGERSTGYSPVTDQKRVDAILKKLGMSLLFYEGATELIQGGFYEKLSATDYALSAVLQNGALYIPKETATREFGALNVSETSLNGVAYVALNDLCKASGKTLLTYGKLYLVSDGSVSLDSAADADTVARITRFFTERNASEIAGAESRTVVAEAGETYTYNELKATIKYCSCPTIAKLGNSIFVAMDTNGAKVLVFESTDGGKTFAFRSMLEKFHFVTLFELNGALYLLGAYTGDDVDHIGIVKSTDGANTWSDMTHFAGPDGREAHTTSNSVLVANGRVYKAYNGRDGAGFEKGCSAYMVSAPVTADLLDPASWTLSNAVDFTTNLFTTHENGSMNTTLAYIEEGNAVLGPDGQLMAIYGLKASPVIAQAAIMTCSADGKTMSFDKESSTSILKFVGGNSKFTVRYDEKSGKYLALVNRNTEERFWTQRNVLTLMVSEDLIHWEQAGDVLVDPTVMNDYISATMHGFQYVDFVFDGEDLLLAVREAMGFAHCFHNANYLTFYRVENYAQYLTD